MTRRLNSYRHQCGCRVWCRRNRWLPSSTCATHTPQPVPTALDYLRRLTQKAIAS